MCHRESLLYLPLGLNSKCGQAVQFLFSRLAASFVSVPHLKLICHRLIASTMTTVHAQSNMWLLLFKFCLVNWYNFHVKIIEHQIFGWSGLIICMAYQ